MNIASIMLILFLDPCNNHIGAVAELYLLWHIVLGKYWVFPVTVIKPSLLIFYFVMIFNLA